MGGRAEALHNPVLGTLTPTCYIPVNLHKSSVEVQTYSVADLTNKFYDL